jgi:hypothetical protein
MPDWQIVSDAYARLLQVRTALDNAVAEAIREANAGALPVLELLVAEVEKLTRHLLDSFQSTATAPSR